MKQIKNTHTSGEMVPSDPEKNWNKNLADTTCPKVLLTITMDTKSQQIVTSERYPNCSNTLQNESHNLGIPK